MRFQFLEEPIFHNHFLETNQNFHPIFLPLHLFTLLHPLYHQFDPVLEALFTALFSEVYGIRIQNRSDMELHRVLSPRLF